MKAERLHSAFCILHFPTILIIGGGPAGSMAAILLARAGARVTLIEQARFPRDKVCGECLSALGVSVLTRHGLTDRLRLRGAIELTRSLFHAPGGESCELPLPLPMLGISRSTLDDFLLLEARVAGATVMQPARCESIDTPPDTSTRSRRVISPADPRADASGVAVTVRSLVDQSISTLHADIALLADGKANLLRHRPPLTGDFGIKTHFTGVNAPENAIELFGVVGHYGGLSAVEGGRWNTSFSVPATRLRAARGQLDRLFAEITAENPAFARRMKNALRCADWHTAPLPRFGVIRDWPRNMIPIGNAAAAIEPIGGEGIGLALRSAEIAAEAVQAQSFDPELLQARYRELWTPRRLACRAAAKLISSPFWSARAIGLLGGDENPLTRSMLSWMGKTDA